MWEWKMWEQTAWMDNSGIDHKGGKCRSDNIQKAVRKNNADCRI